VLVSHYLQGRRRSHGADSQPQERVRRKLRRLLLDRLCDAALGMRREVGTGEPCFLISSRVMFFGESVARAMPDGSRRDIPALRLRCAVSSRRSWDRPSSRPTTRLPRACPRVILRSRARDVLYGSEIAREDVAEVSLQALALTRHEKSSSSPGLASVVSENIAVG
jgi:hypothetical protein